MKRKPLSIIPAVILTVVCVSTGTFAQQGTDVNESTAEAVNSEGSTGFDNLIELKNGNSLRYTGSMELLYADQFSVDYYERGYKYIEIEPDQKILMVPQGYEVPENLNLDITVIYQIPEHIYLAASASFDFFRKLGSVGNITLSSQKVSGWYIPEAIDAMEKGEMLYAGKYSAPDYELILSEGCDLAIENMMISHQPEVKEKLEALGIPVIIERASYEAEPLGRMEWIRFYGALLNKEEEAETYFNEISQKVESVRNQESTGLSTAFFSITTTGAVTVRKSGDYIARSIEMAGGKYVTLDESDEENALSTMTVQMEAFYAAAKNADILIYNSTIEGEIQTIDQLVEKSSLLKDFKAVNEGRVWCVEKNLYQEPLELGEMILDINKILHDPDTPDDRLYFLHRLYS
ncbi:MAG: ABC transporter substrate-binding protein [Parasporobacterium sp.]|nr:ABC transporter substrate-binding protein [Parasporobacterium sp.]